MVELKTVLSENPKCLESRTALRNVLKEKYPTEKRTIHVLLDAYESGVVGQFRKLKRINKETMDGYVGRLMNEYGLRKKYAVEGILAWTKALNITVEGYESSEDTENKPVKSSSSQAKASKSRRRSSYSYSSYSYGGYYGGYSSGSYGGASLSSYGSGHSGSETPSGTVVSGGSASNSGGRIIGQGPNNLDK